MTADKTLPAEVEVDGMCFLKNASVTHRHIQKRKLGAIHRTPYSEDEYVVDGVKHKPNARQPRILPLSIF